MRPAGALAAAARHPNTRALAIGWVANRSLLAHWCAGRARRGSQRTAAQNTGACTLVCKHKDGPEGTTESGCVSTEQLAHKGAPSCGRVLLTVEGGRTAKSYTQRCAQPEPRSGDLRVPGRGAAAQPRSGTFFSIKMGHRSRPYGTHCKRCFIFLTLWSCKTRLSSTRGQSGPVEGVSTRWRARRLRCAQAQGSRAARGTTERSSGPCCAHCLVGRSATRPTWLLAPVGVGAATPPPTGPEGTTGSCGPGPFERGCASTSVVGAAQQTRRASEAVA